ncbi:MAG: Sulfate/thiosulfate import ATP-binding protein CysA [Chloroflexi bacterium ADurb.Bin325]|nr:MAG: Sulfate/thiosulfate import ATP-binding protein CysA [Chloroflexi bacterium ADurb.Bin325]
MTTLQVDQLTKRFAGVERPVVHDISFEVAEGEILALVGPSGCGKTTTLRLIAGLERPDSGVIRLGGRVVASDTIQVPPERRDVGMVFQDHALFPHLSVFDNVAFGLRGLSRSARRARVAELLELVGLRGLAARYPHALSGGERQRVALARALAPQPVVVLMDEPFSSLDADMRLEVREQVRGILKTLHTTAVFVTHDQDEALFMGDRLAVFQHGCLEQIGTPEDVFHASGTRFVAEFMGDSDFLAGETAADGIRTALGTLTRVGALPVGTAVEVALRGDDVDFVPAENGNAVVRERFFRGAFNVYRLALDSGQVVHALKSHTEALPAGTRVRAYISAQHPLAVFPDGQAARLGRCVVCNTEFHHAGPFPMSKM